MEVVRNIGVFLLLVVALVALETDLGVQLSRVGGCAQGALVMALVLAYFRAYP